MNLRTMFRAGRVRRWHANPDLNHTDDRIDGHSGRCARLIIALHPDPSVALLRAVLTHDDGELSVGDVPAPAKRGKLGDELNRRESVARQTIWGVDPTLSDADRLWLKFVDRADAYMWMTHHRPEIKDVHGWPAAREWLADTADVLGVSFDG